MADVDISESMSDIFSERDLDEFSERKPHRSVALIVENRHFWVPRDAMAEYSPVFAKMLYGEFQESKKEEIELPGKTAKDILEMLRCLFPKDGIMQAINYGNVCAVCRLADEYQIAFLERRCTKFIQSMREGHKVIKELFMQGVQIRLKTVVGPCLPLLARFDMEELRPILVALPDHVRSAMFYQIISQTKGHQKLDSCYECRKPVVRCVSDRKYIGYAGVSSSDRVMKQCLKCFTCHKSTVWVKDHEGAMLKGQQCCRCLAPYAETELNVWLNPSIYDWRS